MVTMQTTSGSPNSNTTLAAGRVRRAIGLRQTIQKLLIAAFDWLYACQERSRQRHALRSLDDRMLRDIGIARGEADRFFAQGRSAAQRDGWTG